MGLSQFFTLYPAMGIFIIIIVSLLVGALLNILIHRIPVLIYHDWDRQCQEFQKTYKDPDETVTKLFTSHSVCRDCKQPVSKLQYLPVVGYFFFGRCICGSRSSLRILTVELLSVLLTLYLFQYVGFNAHGFFSVIFTWFLLALFFMDAEYNLLPDKIVLTLLWLGLIVNSFQLFVPINDAIAGAVVGYLIMRGFADFYHWLKKEEGIGYGDCKFVAAIGAWVGLQSLMFVVPTALVLSVFWWIFRMIFPTDKIGEPLPLGPLLALTGWMAMAWHYQSRFQLLENLLIALHLNRY